MHSLRNLCLALAILLPSLASARPVDGRDGLRPFAAMDWNQSRLRGKAQTGVFGAASQGTTYFGGTAWDPVDGRWEALQDSAWTFDSGAGSNFNHHPDHATNPGTNANVNPFKDASLHAEMEGWIGIDWTYGGESPYFRRLTDTDSLWTGAPQVCVGSGVDPVFGAASFWCGITQSETLGFCYATGQGYGNSWTAYIFKTYTYSGTGTVVLTFDYAVHTEPMFDFVHVRVDTTGNSDGITVRTYDGVIAPGGESLTLTPGIDMRSDAGPFRVLFTVESDGAYSDEDGLYATDCGAFTVDNVAVAGGAVDACDFETDDCGFVLADPEPGLGGDWSDIVHMNDLPPMLTTCPCNLQDSVLVFQDLTVAGGGHGLNQNNTAASPWVDLADHGLVGVPGKFVEASVYADVPLLNYIFLLNQVQYYPDYCPVSGAPLETWASPFVFYYGFNSQCTTGNRRYILDASELIPAHAERVRVAFGLYSSCRFFGNCTGLTNTTPWFDNVRFGVYGNPDAPTLFASVIDVPMDSFPQNGSLSLVAPGRVDSNNIKGDSQPESGTSLGDTLVVAGGLPGQGANTGAEVRVQFAVDPGPGVYLSALNAWLASHQAENFWRGQQWYSARMDTSLQGPYANKGVWATLYHEQDPNFSGSDLDTDPNDLDPHGQQSRKLNDIFLDGPGSFFTAGTRINLFYKTRYIDGGGAPTTGVWFTFPDTAYGPLEMEVLPSSAAADSTWNCVLYVDHFDDRHLYDKPNAQFSIETALGNTLTGTSANFEGVPWDRWDVRAPASQQASFGRPLNTQYGATVTQALAYRMIVWNSGNLRAFNITEEDAGVLRPWLNLNDAGFGSRGLYVSGDGVAQSVTGEAAYEPTALALLELDMGVNFLCGTVRDPACNGSGSTSDEACLRVDPVSGVAGNNGDVSFSGNGCPEQRSFDRIEPLTSVVGAAGDEKYVSLVAGDLLFASVSREAATGPMMFKTMLDGGSVHYRRNLACDPGSAQAAVNDRMGRVLSWMGYAGTVGTCSDATVSLDVPAPPGEPTFVTALGASRPNPYTGRGEVAFAFGLGVGGRVTLEVFDVAGRRLKTVVDEAFTPGSYEARWDGTDSAGRAVASGVYFYRLTAGGKEFAKKLVVLGS